LAPESQAGLQLLMQGSWTEVAQGTAAIPRNVGALVRAYLSYHLATTLKAWEAVPR
jgi:hypothetical protein